MSWFHGTKNGSHASTTDRLPLARADELVVEEIGEELLIYDKTTNRAHCLGATAAKVWRACDGYTNTGVLGTKVDLDSETLGQVLDELDSSSLLQDAPQVGHTRREMTVKAARLGAVASIPFVYSVFGPVPMAAATVTVEDCIAYTSDSCGTTAGSTGCDEICECCCCCGGCQVSGNTGCHVCYPAALCPSPAGGKSPQCPGIGLFGITGPCTVSTCSAPSGSNCVPAAQGTPPPSTRNCTVSVTP